PCGRLPQRRTRPCPWRSPRRTRSPRSCRCPEGDGTRRRSPRRSGGRWWPLLLLGEGFGQGVEYQQGADAGLAGGDGGAGVQRLDLADGGGVRGLRRPVAHPVGERADQLIAGAGVIHHPSVARRYGDWHRPAYRPTGAGRRFRGGTGEAGRVVPGLGWPFGRVGSLGFGGRVTRVAMATEPCPTVTSASAGARSKSLLDLPSVSFALATKSGVTSSLASTPSTVAMAIRSLRSIACLPRRRSDTHISVLPTPLASCAWDIRLRPI